MTPAEISNWLMCGFALGMVAWIILSSCKDVLPGYLYLMLHKFNTGPLSKIAWVAMIACSVWFSYTHPGSSYYEDDADTYNYRRR